MRNDHVSCDEGIDQLGAEVDRLTAERDAALSRECARDGVLSELLRLFSDAGRIGAETDVPEGSRFILISDTLAARVQVMISDTLSAPPPPCPHQRRAERLNTIITAICRDFGDAGKITDEEGYPSDEFDIERAPELVLGLRDKAEINAGDAIALWKLACTCNQTGSCEACEIFNRDRHEEMERRDARQRAEGAAAELEQLVGECGEYAGMAVDKDRLKARAAELRKLTEN